jgi:hypothetical protein
MAWLQWVEQSSVATAVRDSVWLYPSIEILHITGFVALVGAAAMFDLRLLGVSRQLPVDQVSKLLFPVSRLSVFVVVPSGLALFISDATAMSVNPAFRLKLVLLVCAALNAYAFHRWCLRTPDRVSVNHRPLFEERLMNRREALEAMVAITRNHLHGQLLGLSRW